MSRKVEILIAGRSPNRLQLMQTLLKGQKGVLVTLRAIVNGHTDPLQDLKVMPDLLILQLDSNWQPVLDAFMSRPISSRPFLLVTGPGQEMNILRHAMQAGARDYLAEPVVESDLLAFIEKMVEELSARSEYSEKRMIAVINAKGGSGATLLTSNLAHIVATAIKQRVAAVDLDLQFGTLPLYLDLSLRHSLMEVLHNADTLDALALEAYMTRHTSGLQLLGPITSEMILPEEVKLGRMRKLMDFMEEIFDVIFVDLPRQIDQLTSMVMEDADHIIVVMQQSVTHLRDSKHIVSILKHELDIPDGKIMIAVNRYQSNHLLSLDDIKRTLDCNNTVVIPNDFRNVDESINTGIPLYTTARSAQITKALVKLAETLSGCRQVKKPGLIRRAFSHLGN